MRLPLLLSLTLLLVSAPLASAQPSGPAQLYDFEFRGPPTVVELEAFPGAGNATLYFKDLSRDNPSNLVPGAPPVRVPLEHRVLFTATPVSPDPQGWHILGYTSNIASYGDMPPQNVDIQVLADPGAKNPYFVVRMTATMHSYDGQEQLNKSVEVTFRAKGLSGIDLRMPPPLTMAPHSIEHATLTATNYAIFPQQVLLEVTANPCNLGYGLPGAVVLEPAGREGSTKTLTVSLAAPSDQIYYQGDSCQLSLNAVSIDLGRGAEGGVAINTPSTLLVKVEGVYVDPTWVFALVAAVAILALVLVALARLRAYREQEILVRPHKPWTIPVERVYLAQLKRKDPRAWYVVRHYLMEDEYRSSLLWYKAYKAATKGNRKKESLILKQEKRYEAWKAKWQRKLEEPAKDAARFERRMQAKAERRARRRHRKELRAWRKAVRRLQKGHAKRVAKAGERHEKALRRALKKGRPAPPEPAIAAPELPPEPKPVPVALAETRYGRRVRQHDARMERRRGNLEVRYEKADARRLARLRRKVQRIGRKLDDPDFVEEHPLLRSAQ